MKTRKEEALGASIVLEPEERIVLDLTGEGKTEKEIRRKLGWSDQRVRFTIGSLYWRFGARDQVELVAQAFLRGFLSERSRLNVDLDDHELRLLTLLAQGKETREIVSITHWGRRRINEDLTLLYKKLKVTGRLHAVIQGFRCELLHSGNVPLRQPGKSRGGWQGISPRQREVLQLLKYGFEDWEIKRALDVTANNLHQIRWRIRKKLRVKTDQEAVIIAQNKGILD